MKKRFAILLALLLSLLVMTPAKPAAAKATDEIIKYTVTVDVNDDATLNMLYHIEWKVLDDVQLGPLDWVHIGIPNSHYISCDAVSNNIDHINMDIGYSSSYADVYFTKKYYKNETVSFDFLLVQDYMYEMNILKDGETVYYFTPGWFDGIAIDELVIDWNADKSIACSHGATPENGRLIWSGSLSAGAKFGEISVTYPSDAYAFDSSKTVRSDGSYSDGNDDYGYNSSYDDSDDGSAFLGFVFLVIIIVAIVNVIKKANDYSGGSGFNTTTTTKKKITRTLIKYYPTCPGCGAPRPENAETCEYCGRSFIQSEEVVEEKEIKEPEKYKNEGTYRYGSSPNTYMRVHVTHIPVVSSPSRSRSSCVHSSCAHSSCACAHSCACACACACAGGGRAGCSTKDFYNTNLKLSQLKRRTEKK
ncbi:MAG: zinc ribbon domain-containing protein [Lachnospiraceae bacterium]|nr:zinc ribbon domain-containing protein [Lachnospiraceae bacterium]